MSKYQDWILKQGKDFIQEICGSKQPEIKFKDYNKYPITLEELKQLDNKFIMQSSAEQLTPRGQEI